jgi:isopentenyl diphosphate isomerase/L-lactate dehydrogenase-like FMN-dependent dehydrogenase
VNPVDGRFVSLHQFVAAAYKTLDRTIWDYIIGASDTETTLARNRHALDALAFQPRVLNDVSDVDCGTTFLGKRLRIPVFTAPVGYLERIDPGAGATVATAVRAFGAGQMQSSVSEPELEETVKVGGEALQIYQLYVRGDAAWADERLRRVVEAGWDAVCVTVDTALLSRRERDIVKGWGRPTVGIEHQARVNWRDVERFRAALEVPLLLKGIATVADALRAVDCGVDVIYVSNHGGRQLDHGRGSMDVLPEVVAAVGGRAEVAVDGGFSRGSDIVKAIALGASAVGIGRLYLYALAVGGAPGVVRLFELLETEVRICLGLLGVTSLAALDPAHVCRVQPIGTPGVHSAFPLLRLPKNAYRMPKKR